MHFVRLMAKFNGQSGRLGPLDFLAYFEFYMAVLGVGRASIGLVAPLRFNMLDSQPEKSDMDPFPSGFH